MSAQSRSVAAPLLALQDVHCVLGGQPILAGLNLQVNGGERVGVIGPNGAGKTTLFQVISGLRPLHAGSVWLNGRRIDRLPPHHIARAGVGRSFQSPQVFGRLSVADNLRCALLAQTGGNWLRRLARDTALEQDTARWLHALQLQALAQVSAQHIDYASLRALELGLALMRKRQAAPSFLTPLGEQVGEPTLGALMRKRQAAPSFLIPHGEQVGEPTLGALMRKRRAAPSFLTPLGGRVGEPTLGALSSKAPLLLLDEPTAGMSRAQAGHMLDLIEQVCQDSTLLLIEHDLDAVFRLASRVIVLHQGRVLADGTPQDIRADARVQAIYLGLAP
ncbi:MAG: ATP-binding cassette domain-containing protein [Thiomonas sp.]|nr:ATP-binding cassette domain-containing protein [Thiomonas sp.]